MKFFYILFIILFRLCAVCTKESESIEVTTEVLPNSQNSEESEESVTILSSDDNNNKTETPTHITADQIGPIISQVSYDYQLLSIISCKVFISIVTASHRINNSALFGSSCTSFKHPRTSDYKHCNGSSCFSFE